MLQEATELMNKMKNIPGVGNIQSMLSKMGIGLDGLGGGGGKVNTAAMEAKLNQRMKLATTKERIRAKAEANAKAKAAAALSEPAAEITTTPMNNHILTDEEITKIFGSGEKKIERTPRGSNKQENNGKKKKRDKK